MVCRKCIYGFLFFGTIFSFSLYGQQDYQEWLRQQQASFQEYKDSRDKAFTEFLQKEWEEFQAMQGMVRDPEPKPDIMPKAEPREEKPEEIKDVPRIKDVDIPAPKVKPKPQLKPGADMIKKGTPLKVMFYGTELAFTYDRTMLGSLPFRIDNKVISDYWERMGTSDFEPLLRQLKSYRSRLGLNDWGYAVLLYTVGMKMYEQSPNPSTLFTWFYLLKSEYNARVGYNTSQVSLLLPSDNAVFDVPYLTLDGRKYFIIPLDGSKQKISSITTYQGDYPGTNKTINFRITRSPEVNAAFIHRQLQFTYGGREYSIPIRVNENIVDFYTLYPQTDIPIYFGASVSDVTGPEMLASLKKIIQGKPETEAVNIILRFVQTAFDYATDKSQFGFENYLFPEETLFYPASDCEDRAALFAYLVRNLLGLQVVGLDYPGHVAAAVKFSSPVEGDGITYQGAWFTVCDPTYINANYGMTMPSVQDKQAAVFQIP